MSMSNFVKGEKPRDLDAAKGGLVLDRVRSFIKDPDDFHPLGTGMNGPENAQPYDKAGPSKGGKDVSKRTGDKCIPMSAIK